MPGDTVLAQNIWEMMRHVPTFGDNGEGDLATEEDEQDLEVFRPERFMDVSPEKRLEMERVVELGFGMGRYMCAGKTVAFLELNKLFVELLRELDFYIANPKRPWVEHQYHLFLISDMRMRVTERRGWGMSTNRVH